MHILISALGRLGHEDCEFQDSLDYTVRPCLETNKQKKPVGASAVDTCHFLETSVLGRSSHVWGK